MLVVGWPACHRRFSLSAQRWHAVDSQSCKGTCLIAAAAVYCLEAAWLLAGSPQPSLRSTAPMYACACHAGYPAALSLDATHIAWTLHLQPLALLQVGVAGLHGVRHPRALCVGSIPHVRESRVCCHPCSAVVVLFVTLGCVVGAARTGEQYVTST